MHEVLPGESPGAKMVTTVAYGGGRERHSVSQYRHRQEPTTLKNRRPIMKKRMIKLATALSFALALTACGQDTKEAAKETARSAGKLAVTAVSEAAAGAVDVAAEAAKGTASAAAEQAGKAKDRVVEAAKEGVDSVKAKASSAVKEAKGGK